QLGCKFQPLGFAAAQGWARLAELQVAESRIDKKRERPRNLRIGGKELGRLLDRHLHDVADALIVIEDLEGLRVVTPAAAIFARHVAAREKTHLQLDRALAGTGLAPAPFGVERKPARRITTHSRDRQLPIELANFVKNFDVSRRSRARRLADRRLVDVVNGLESAGAGD